VLACAGVMLDADPIRTGRLEIRRFSEADLDAAYAFNSDAKARHFMGGVVSRTDSDSSFRRHIVSVGTTGFGARAVVERDAGLVVGYCGLQKFAATEEVELFYGLVPAAWGRGIATEASRAFVSLGFRSLSVDHLVAIVHPQNLGSIGVLEKLCFRRVGTYLHPRTQVEHLLLHLRAAESTDG